MVDYRKCDPSHCHGGRCICIETCPRKLLKQEEPLDAPMLNQTDCRGCGDCVRACPLGAIRLASG